MTQTTLREYLRTTEDAISSGRIDEAMANCQNILAYFPEALEAQRLLGEVYLAQGQVEEAQQTFEWILANDPENVIVYCDRALISERVADIDTALDCYQQAYELSRGNANIRQEFNQLSARAGQQEFMFSRAGLARLYMRGDLLTQAIQEWNAVLAISPERLDARLGLIETYWREGRYDQAEQFATQLLEEIPTCLKALLYLAHMVSISNMQRARDLVLRAETLDPELRMAQEIFADLAASQPNDPFLALIQKEPIMLEKGVPISRQPASIPAIQKPAVQPAAPYADWENVGPASPLPKAPSGANWNASTEAPWISNQVEQALPSWQTQMEPQTPAQAEQPWYEKDQFNAPTADPMLHWEKMAEASPAQSSWNLEVQEQEQEEEQVTPPAWLDTLTRSEQAQMAAPASLIPPVSPVPAQPALPVSQVPAQPEMPAARVETTPPAFQQAQLEASQEAEEMPFFLPSDDEENEGEMGWPEWLKSLGAEAMEPETPSAPLAAIDPTPIKPFAETRKESYTSQPAFAEQPDVSAQHATEAPGQPDWMQQLSRVEDTPAQPAAPDWMQQFSTSVSEPVQSAAPDWMQQFSTPVSEPVQSATPDWMQQFASAEIPSRQQPAAAAPMAEQEQRYIASLEDLEKNLQSQGFAPLAPGSLASIAQAQASAPLAAQEQPSLASALAQLNNMTPPLASPAPNEPWWNATISQVPEQPAPAATQVPVTRLPEEQLNPFAALGAQMATETPTQMPTLPATPAPLAPAFQQSIEQAPVPATAPLMPTYRSDVLLDSELETTMKRPAIKLQPMAHADRPYHNGKALGVERATIEHADDSNLNNHDRLVRGYQYQLSGAYDEAMQDYRLIIRNAPELLDEVISNMRALLKINPRFSLGYRVLGDAYMRKGEYLQAMESYNKALTMAKKGPGQK